MTEKLITSRSNPLVRELRALTQKKERARRREFLVEGIQPVLAALTMGAPVRMLVVAPELLTSRAAREAIHQAERGGTRVVNLSGHAFAAVAERENPSGLLAVVGIQTKPLAELLVTERSVFVALYEVGNPGNLGTILRTADAVGADGVILIGATTDPYAPAAVKASRGTLFRVPLAQIDAGGELLEWVARTRQQLVVARDDAPQDLWGIEWRTPRVLLLGSEGAGLPEELAHAGEAVRVPMFGAVDSLNLAVAAGVLLYEGVRRTKS